MASPVIPAPSRADPIFDLRDRRIWIIGGAGYFGKEVVTALDRLGAIVSCIDLKDKAREFVVEQKLSPQVIPVSLDLVETAEVLEWIEHECVEDRRPDGAVFLTTPMSATRLADLTKEELNTYNEAGLGALFSAVRATGSAMVQQKRGSIVLFSSMYGQVAPDPSTYDGLLAPNPIQYGMQKAAINQMARYLAVHWGKDGVRCNTIIPGAFPHPATQANHPEFITRLQDKIPLGRIGTAIEVTGAVVFLLSDSASFVTGHGLVVDGGWTAW